MIRNGRDEFSEAFRDDMKAQDRSRQTAAALKTSAERKPSARGSRLSVRGQRVAASDDRSPTRASARRSLVQRGVGRQPSRDELDFAVTAEPCARGQTLQRDDHSTEAPTPPWVETRKP